MTLFVGVTADNYRAANEAANNGKERKDLYTDAWDGDVYKGETIWRFLSLGAVQRAQRDTLTDG
jgi:hypothetical protein